ncbi:LOW QUALITY PROTEIN: hypothetical protein JCM19039_2626 [Geomicrobium sp. JCM 19039]|nr:LOW QUALITY PROTEIN: hypothetical protein JCM19039_2626 [Geomicrobium sp. JCM 19039]
MFFGYRTLKTAIGAAVAIFIAQWLNLDFFAAAAIITVLCIRGTKKGSLRKAWELFVASMTGLFFAVVIFEVLGYHPLSLAVLIVLFIPALLKFKSIDGIITSIVILLHIYTVGTVSFTILWNEFLLIVIGVTVGLIMNLYMPSLDDDIYEDQIQLEEYFERILKEYSKYLYNKDDDWDGKELTLAGDLIKNGKAKALRAIDNHFLRHDDYFYHYFDMREKQLAILERILPFISTLETTSEGKQMASFLKRLSGAVNPGNTAGHFLEELDVLRHNFSEHQLPKNHVEFTTRASLFYIIHEMEEYLTIKQMFKPDENRTHMIKKKKKLKRKGVSS